MRPLWPADKTGLFVSARWAKGEFTLSDEESKKSEPINRYASLLGIELLDADKGQGRARLPVHDDLFHSGGIVHGGAAYSLADSTMAMALKSCLEFGEECSTIEMKISYLAPVRKGALSCEARVIRKGARIAFLEADVSTDDRLIATATSTFAILRG